MNKAVLIIPYFGKLPSWFQLFLNSCEPNRAFDWMIFTDDTTAYNYPSNVQVNYGSFAQMQKRFRQKLGQGISLERPYKLCDYRPAYGYVFEEDIAHYTYWGHCDLDLLFGDLDGMVAPRMDEGYDKIFAAGHLTLYKNTPENNKRFMLTLEQENLFAMYSEREKNFGFDEDGGNPKNIHAIYLQEKFPVFSEDLSFNCSDKYYRFRRCSYLTESRRWQLHKYVRAAWFWHEGKVLQLIPGRQGPTVCEYAYMHFQGRKWMRFFDSAPAGTLWISPDGFRNCAVLPKTNAEVKKYAKCFGGMTALSMVMLRLRLRLGKIKIWLLGLRGA